MSATPSTDTRQRAFVRLGSQSSAGAEPRGSDARGSAAATLQPADQSCGAITRLLAAASHDLRQPLQAIGLWVALLREQAQDPKVRDILGKVQTTAQGAERVVDTLLDVTRLELGVVRVHLADFAIASLLEHVASTFAPLARDRQIELRVHHSSAIGRSDPDLLERILFNFVANAIRYSTRGAVLVGCRRHRGFLAIEVWDTGPGIQQERLEAIFQEFVQLGTAETDHHHGSVGLGLSIAQRTAALLGHPIQVMSCIGKGSCFRVEIPLGESRPDRLTRHAPTTTGADDCATTLFGSFVVVVEDERDQREAIGLLLRDWGCHVVAAASAAEALELLQDHLRLPNLLLADYRLTGDENGLAAIRAIRSALGENIPAAIISGECPSVVDGSDETADLALLRKPVSPERLHQCLVSLLFSASWHPV
ncbi:hybrid sensor histidine kinase/response regulator [Accumulibacter sp.]|uniref:ATP-binding response regulator n=1 Tax=Accumulibacter sp. TaxID=2053492 RepID=UPI00339006C5